MQRSLDLLALTKRLEMISTKPAVGRHFFRRFEFKGEKRRRSQAFYTGTSCLKREMDNLQVNRFVLKPIFFSVKRDYMENFQLVM